MRQALLRLLGATGERTANDACHAVLFGIGNDHKGTYYPAALSAVPLLVRIAVDGPPWPAYAAVEVLTDLLISFAPEPGYEHWRGKPVDLIDELECAMTKTGLSTTEAEAAVGDREHTLLARLRATVRFPT